jgi:hypothetical protein
MKYIISETRLKSLMWDYLNAPEYNILADENEIFLENDEHGYDWGYTFYDGRLLVSNHIVLGLEGLFNISGENALEYAGEWFEDHYHYPVDEIINWDGWA